MENFEQIFKSKFTKIDYSIERIVDDHMVKMKSVDGRLCIITEKKNLKLFYDKMKHDNFMPTKPVAGNLTSKPALQK